MRSGFGGGGAAAAPSLPGMGLGPLPPSCAELRRRGGHRAGWGWPGAPRSEEAGLALPRAVCSDQLPQDQLPLCTLRRAAPLPPCFPLRPGPAPFPPPWGRRVPAPLPRPDSLQSSAHPGARPRPRPSARDSRPQVTRGRSVCPRAHSSHVVWGSGPSRLPPHLPLWLS